MNAQQLHARCPVIDGHADSIWRYRGNPSAFFEEGTGGHLDSQRLRRTGQNVQIMAIYTPPEQTDLAALQYGLDFIHAIHAVLESPANLSLTPPYRLILCASDLRAACLPEAYGFLVFLEGASPLRGSLTNLDLFHRLGVRGVTITHNHDNEAARGCFAQPSASGGRDAGRGLTGFGREMVKEMDRRGMVIDLAHSNEDTFWDTLALTRRPVIDSHTGLRAFRDFPRNLTDEQLGAVARTGGVVCIDFLPDHLATRTEPRTPLGVDHVVRVIDHAVEKAGIEHVGLGADWDGFEDTFVGLEDCAALPNLTAALLSAGYQETDVARILGGNMLRALCQGMEPAS